MILVLVGISSVNAADVSDTDVNPDSTDSLDVNTRISNFNNGNSELNSINDNYNNISELNSVDDNNELSDNTYDYESKPVFDSVTYTVGKSDVIITVTANYTDGADIDGPMYVNINGTSIEIPNVDGNSKNFNFNLSMIDSELVNGENIITFSPSAAELNKFNNVNLGQLKINAVVPYSGPVYVSVNGNDNNNGTEDYPLLTVAKALELSKTLNSTGIYILEGRYYEHTLIINNPIIITGIGNVVIDGNYSGRLFVTNSTDSLIEFNNIVFVNGKAPTDLAISDDHWGIDYYSVGGAIFVNRGNVTVNNCTFINNTADDYGGAIDWETNFGIINNSVFINNTASLVGGAIDWEGANGTIVNCTFINNTAQNGGAIDWEGINGKIYNSTFIKNAGEVGGAVRMITAYYCEGHIIVNSTFISNYAVQNGGAVDIENEGGQQYYAFALIRNNLFIDNYGFNGGAISDYYGGVSSISNLFINNTAGYGGAIANIGELELYNNTIINCTASENGNYIFNIGDVTSGLNVTFLSNSTVVSDDGKAVLLNATVYDFDGNPISGSYADFYINGKKPVNTPYNLTEGVCVLRFVPRENGTFTVTGNYGHSIYTGYNKVTNGTLVVSNAIPEYFGVIYVSELTGNDDNTGSEENPVKTFNQGYLLAVRDGGTRSIVLMPGRYTATGYTINETFRLMGIGNPTIDGLKSKTIFSFYGKSKDNFTVIGIRFTNATASATTYGGQLSGSAIFVKGGNLYLENCTFDNNNASESGGAIYVNKGMNLNTGAQYTATAKIINCVFTNNTAKYDGGAIGIYCSDLTIINTAFISNTAKYGGAIGYPLMSTGKLSIYNCSFIKNNGLNRGGAICDEISTSLSSFIVTNTLFDGNTALNGSAIYGCCANISYCVFTNNIASEIGGAVYFESDESQVLGTADHGSLITYSIFDNNTAETGKSFMGKSTYLGPNFWGKNIESQEDFKNKGFCVNNDSVAISPENWINLNIIGLDTINTYGNYGYIVKFLLNNKTELDTILPNYTVRFSNIFDENKLNQTVLLITDNEGNLNFNISSGQRERIIVKSMFNNNILGEYDIRINPPKTAQDLQKIIDESEDGQTVDLGNNSYVDINNVNITKNITIIGGYISGTSSEPVFNIINTSDIVKFEIRDTVFNTYNNNTIINVNGLNSTKPNLIEVPQIDIHNITVKTNDDNVNPYTVTVLKINSNRTSLSPTNPINISSNNITNGVKPLMFNVDSINTNDGVYVPREGILGAKSHTHIVYSNMTQTAVDFDHDERGNYFVVKLVDDEGRAIEGKFIQIGFNGVVYNRTTNGTGEVSLQINLAYSGKYTFAIAFLSDDEYSGSFVVAKIQINKKTANLKVPNKTFRASQKTKTLTISLTGVKTTDSRATVPGIYKTVRVTVNGKTYTVRTNSKGQASINIKISKKGTYTVVTKFAGDGTFNSKTVKTKITVN